MAKITLSVIKADVGGYVGHSSTHPQLLAVAEERLSEAKKNNLIRPLMSIFALVSVFDASLRNVTSI